jgi:large exoprotein involved in heme utilization and adhesion
VTTPILRLTDGGKLEVNNQGSGNAGKLQVMAGSIELKGGGTLTAATKTGEGGDVQIQAQTLLLRDHSAITATAGGTGRGGNITIVSPTIVGIENSDIVANAVKGQGGTIQISTQGIFGLQYRDQLTPASDITASSEFGLSGSVTIQTPIVNPSSGLIELATNLVNANQQLVQGCGSHSGSNFVITGRGGGASNPSQWVNPDRPWQDIRNLAQSAVPTAPTALTTPLIEATRWQLNTQGQPQLLAGTSVAPTPDLVTCARSSLDN